MWFYTNAEFMAICDSGHSYTRSSVTSVPRLGCNSQALGGPPRGLGSRFASRKRKKESDPDLSSWSDLMRL